MKKYRFGFVHGYTNKFMIWETDAASLEQAKDNFYATFGGNFEHHITNISENGRLIYEA